MNKNPIILQGRRLLVELSKGIGIYDGVATGRVVEMGIGLPNACGGVWVGREVLLRLSDSVRLAVGAVEYRAVDIDDVIAVRVTSEQYVQHHLTEAYGLACDLPEYACTPETTDKANRVSGMLRSRTLSSEDISSLRDLLVDMKRADADNKAVWLIDEILHHLRPPQTCNK